MSRLFSTLKGFFCGRNTAIQSESGSLTTVVVRRTPVDAEVSAMLKKATEFKSKNELHKAIKCLEKADVLANKSGLFSWRPSNLRVPMYLQQANRYDEAMTVFSQYLLTDPANAANMLQHQPIHIRRRSSCNAFADIYDKMRLAATRQGMEREAVFFSLASLVYRFQAEWIGESPHRAVFIETSKSHEHFMKRMKPFKSAYTQSDKLENLYKIFTEYTKQPQKIELFLSCCMSELELQLDNRLLPELRQAQN